jgi:uncharacterized protein (UPF0332 family)
MTPEKLWVAQLLALCSVAEGAANVAELRRAAISRAYYAAFSEARALMRAQHPTASTREPSHQQVIEWLSSSNQQRRKMSQFLRRFKDLRCLADYESAWSPSEADVKTALQYAHMMLDELR